MVENHNEMLFFNATNLPVYSAFLTQNKLSNIVLIALKIFLQL